MVGLDAIGKTLLVVGGFLAVVGLILVFAGRIPFLGRLPGDIVVQRGSFSLYFPIVTFLILSIALTIVLNIILRLLNR